MLSNLKPKDNTNQQTDVAYQINCSTDVLETIQTILQNNKLEASADLGIRKSLPKIIILKMLHIKKDIHSINNRKDIEHVSQIQYFKHYELNIFQLANFTLLVNINIT